MKYISITVTPLTSPKEKEEKPVIYCDGNWMVWEGPSPFVSRTGRTEIRVGKRADHGIRKGGLLYATVVVYDKETGEVIREYGTVPDSLSYDNIINGGV